MPPTPDKEEEELSCSCNGPAESPDDTKSDFKLTDTNKKEKKSRTLHIAEFNIINIQQFWTHTIRSSSDF